MGTRGAKTRLRRRDGHDCHWCGGHLSKRNTTRDHVIPRTEGGTYHHENLVLACGECNHARGSTRYLAHAEHCGLDPIETIIVWHRAALRHRIITGDWPRGW
jgi:hypothetical protein